MNRVKRTWTGCLNKTLHEEITLLYFTDWIIVVGWVGQKPGSGSEIMVPAACAEMDGGFANRQWTSGSHDLSRRRRRAYPVQRIYFVERRPPRLPAGRSC